MADGGSVPVEVVDVSVGEQPGGSETAPGAGGRPSRLLWVCAAGLAVVVVLAVLAGHSGRRPAPSPDAAASSTQPAGPTGVVVAPLVEPDRDVHCPTDIDCQTVRTATPGTLAAARAAFGSATLRDQSQSRPPGAVRIFWQEQTVELRDGAVCTLTEARNQVLVGRDRTVSSTLVASGAEGPADPTQSFFSAAQQRAGWSLTVTMRGHTGWAIPADDQQAAVRWLTTAPLPD